MPAWISLILITVTLYWQDQTRGQKTTEPAQTAQERSALTPSTVDAGENQSCCQSGAADSKGNDGCCGGGSGDSCCQSEQATAPKPMKKTSDAPAATAQGGTCCQGSQDDCGCNGEHGAQSTSSVDDVPQPVELNFKYTAQTQKDLISKDAGVLILYGSVTGNAKVCPAGKNNKEDPRVAMHPKASHFSTTVLAHTFLSFLPFFAALFPLVTQGICARAWQGHGGKGLFHHSLKPAGL